MESYPLFKSYTMDNLNYLDSVCFNEIQNSSLLLSVMDLDGNIIFINNIFCEVSKYNRKDFIGNSFKLIRHPETPNLLFKDMWTKIKNGIKWKGETKNRAKDGSEFWLQSTITPIIDINNNLVKFLCTSTDITHKKNIENELNEAKKIIDLDLFENVSYAKKIHSALLTNEDEIRNTFPKSFLYYKAQKIISGDFYGFYKQNNKSIIVVGDSTGHGLSASYISIIALNIINSALKSGFNHPEEILQSVHYEMHNVTHSNSNLITESSDTIMCSIDHENYILNYSSAKMRGLIIRNKQIIELQKDKCSIGEYSNKRIQLSKFSIQLKKNDCLYLFSDGIVDQFGGELDKKFGYKNLLQNLLKISNYPMQKQKETINYVLKTWQGNNEQTDDMTLLGFKIE
jgi:PAS domain S-box-containing protein